MRSCGVYGESSIHTRRRRLLLRSGSFSSRNVPTAATCNGDEKLADHWETFLRRKNPDDTTFLERTPEFRHGDIKCGYDPLVRI